MPLNQTNYPLTGFLWIINFNLHSVCRQQTLQSETFKCFAICVVLRRECCSIQSLISRNISLIVVVFIRQPPIPIGRLSEFTISYPLRNFSNEGNAPYKKIIIYEYQMLPPHHPVYLSTVTATRPQHLKMKNRCVQICLFRDMRLGDQSSNKKTRV